MFKAIFDNSDDESSDDEEININDDIQPISTNQRPAFVNPRQNSLLGNKSIFSNPNLQNNIQPSQETTKEVTIKQKPIIKTMTSISQSRSLVSSDNIQPDSPNSASDIENQGFSCKLKQTLLTQYLFYYYSTFNLDTRIFQFNFR